MKIIDFQITALSILAARGEMRGYDLWQEINRQVREPSTISKASKNKTWRWPKLIEAIREMLREYPVSLGEFHVNMDALVKAGDVTREMREDPTRQRQKHTRAAYYKITDQGGKRRTALITEQQRGVGAISGAAPRPA